jgi:hypothetical protein
VLSQQTFSSRRKPALPRPVPDLAAHFTCASKIFLNSVIVRPRIRSSCNAKMNIPISYWGNIYFIYYILYYWGNNGNWHAENP